MRPLAWLRPLSLPLRVSVCALSYDGSLHRALVRWTLRMARQRERENERHRYVCMYVCQYNIYIYIYICIYRDILVRSMAAAEVWIVISFSDQGTSAFLQVDTVDASATPSLEASRSMTSRGRLPRSSQAPRRVVSDSQP